MSTSTSSQAIRDGVGCVRSFTRRYGDGVLFAHVEGPVHLITPSWLRNEFAYGLLGLKSSAKTSKIWDVRGIQEDSENKKDNITTPRMCVMPAAFCATRRRRCSLPRR